MNKIQVKNLAINEKDFTKNSIEEATEIYNNVNLEPIQRKVVETFGSILHNYISIMEIALRGFALRGIRNWQIAEKKTVGEIMTMAPNDRINAVEKMTQFVYETLKQVVRDSAKHPQIKKGIESFMDVYSKQFAQR